MGICKSSYRIIKAQWGIAIDITGEVTSMKNYSEKEFCIQINEGLWIRILNSLTSEEEKLIQKCLTKISKDINRASLFNLDTLIIFNDIDYNPCDYQLEGLIGAVYQWISDTFKIDTPKIDVSFNKKINKYEFEIDK